MPVAKFVANKALLASHKNIVALKLLLLFYFLILPYQSAKMIAKVSNSCSLCEKKVNLI